MPNERNKIVLMHIFGNMGVSNSVSIKIEGRIYRPLVDIGVKLSVINSRVYKAFQPGPELQRKSINLQTANESSL